MTPDSGRLARACHLVAERRDDGKWRVMGGAREHIVSADGSECDCADFLYRPGVFCKHRSLVLLRLGNADVIAALREIVPRRKATVAKVATQNECDGSAVSLVNSGPFSGSLVALRGRRVRCP